jgi:integrase
MADRTVPRSPRPDTREWENDKKYGGRLRHEVGSNRYRSKVPNPSAPGNDLSKTLHAPNWTEARKLHAKRLVDSNSGEEPESSRKTLADLWTPFETRFEGKVLSGERAATTLERYRIQWKKHIEPDFKQPVQKIRFTHIEAWLNDKRRQGLSSSTVTSLYRLLGLLLNQAVREGIIRETPLKRIDDPPRQRAKTPPRRLTDEECSALIKHAPASYRVLIALLCFTGLRISEALGLLWENVDLANLILRIEKQLERKKRGQPVRRVPLKSARRNGGDRREVDLVPEAVALLKKHKEAAFASGHARPTDFVFCTETGAPMYFRNVATRGLDKAAEAAKLNREGVPDLTPHDLRHTAVSRWIACGIDVVEVARQAGDTVAVITDVYAGEFDRATRAATNRDKIAAGTKISLAGGSPQ